MKKEGIVVHDTHKFNIVKYFIMLIFKLLYIFLFNRVLARPRVLGWAL